MYSFFTNTNNSISYVRIHTFAQTRRIENKRLTILPNFYTLYLNFLVKICERRAKQLSNNCTKIIFTKDYFTLALHLDFVFCILFDIIYNFIANLI